MIILFFFSLVAAIVEWLAVARHARRVEYLAKPAALGFLIVGFLWVAPRPFEALTNVFALGLVLSLAGDIFLMLPGDRFLPGLAAFLLAHLAYIAAFNIGGLLLTPSSWTVAAAILFVAAWVLKRLVAAMRHSGHRRLVGPVVAYGVVLGLMLWSAICTLFRADWATPAASLTSLGGTLFFLSDTMLAWHRFARPLPGGRVLEMITYHLAQYALTAGVLVRLGAF